MEIKGLRMYYLIKLHVHVLGFHATDTMIFGKRRSFELIPKKTIIIPVLLK